MRDGRSKKPYIPATSLLPAAVINDSGLPLLNRFYTQTSDRGDGVQSKKETPR